MQDEALLVGAPAPSMYDWLVARIKEAAKRSTRGKVTHEEELANGRYIVSEEWPDKTAYLEYQQIRMTLEAMLYTEGASPGGEP